MNIPLNLLSIFRTLTREGYSCYITGGAVRDYVLGYPVNDYDVVVVGGGDDRVASVRYILGARVIDISLKSNGKNVFEVHDGEDVFQFSVFRDLSEDARNRDFTVNALYYSFIDGEITDIVGGLEDIYSMNLRVISSAFASDPLRILRAARFMSKYGMTLIGEDYFSAIIEKFMFAFNNPNNAHRLYTEFSKIVTSRKPSLGMGMLMRVGALPPEIMAMVGCPQSAEYHPEGDVFSHTLHVMDYASQRAFDLNMSYEDSVVIGMAALLHDIGKPETTIVFENGDVASMGHEHVGADIATGLLARLGFPNALSERIVALIRCHMRRNIETTAAVRRLSVSVSPSTLNELALFMECDSSGRPPLPQGQPSDVANMLRIANQIDVSDGRPSPIFLGRHLISIFGMTPSPKFRPILDAVFEAQLDGKVSTLEDAVMFVRDSGLA